MSETVTARDALEWLVYLHHGVGKAGAPPTEDEWAAAIQQGVDVLDRLRRDSGSEREDGC